MHHYTDTFGVPLPEGNTPHEQLDNLRAYWDDRVQEHGSDAVKGLWGRLSREAALWDLWDAERRRRERLPGAPPKSYFEAGNLYMESEDGAAHFYYTGYSKIREAELYAQRWHLARRKITRPGVSPNMAE